MDLVHRLLVRKFAATLGTFETVLCFTVLGNGQRLGRAQGVKVNLVHRLLVRKFAVALKAFETMP